MIAKLIIRKCTRETERNSSRFIFLILDRFFKNEQISCGSKFILRISIVLSHLLVKINIVKISKTSSIRKSVQLLNKISIFRQYSAQHLRTNFPKKEKIELNFFETFYKILCIFAWPISAYISLAHVTPRCVASFHPRWNPSGAKAGVSPRAINSRNSCAGKIRERKREREKEKTAKISSENLTADFRRGIGLGSIQRGKNVAFPRPPCSFPLPPEGFIPFVESKAKDKSKIHGISLQGKRRRGKNDEEEDNPMNGSKEQEGWRDRGLGDCGSLKVGLGNATCGMRRTRSCGSDGGGGGRSRSIAASGDYGWILA